MAEARTGWPAPADSGGVVAPGQFMLELRAFDTALDLMEQAAAEYLHLHPTDLRAMEIVARTGGLTAGALAAEMGLSAAAVTGLVDRMQAAGYARRGRDPDDRRRVMVLPTAEGARRSGRAFDAMIEKLVGIVASYPTEQVTVIAEFLRRCTAVVTEHTGTLRAAALRRAAP